MALRIFERLDSGTYRTIDLATLGYAGVATVAVLRSLSGDVIPGWPWLLVAHVLLAFLVWLAPRGRAAGPVGEFLADWYPMLLLGALYGEVGVLTLDAGFQNDLAVQHLELWVFGSEISYRWIREMPNVWLSWFLHSCYLAYYAILYASPFGMWVLGRRDQARHTIFAVMVTFYFCYIVFLFFPVAGPRYAFDLAHNAATQVGPARLTQWILERGDSWGAAFPSSHVAASVVATGMALRYCRRLGWVLVPFTVGLVLAVVYGQFHYGVDALAGLVIAGTMLAAMAFAKAEVPAEEAAGVLGAVET